LAKKYKPQNDGVQSGSGDAREVLSRPTRSTPDNSHLQDLVGAGGEQKSPFLDQAARDLGATEVGGTLEEPPFKYTVSNPNNISNDVDESTTWPASWVDEKKQQQYFDFLGSQLRGQTMHYPTFDPKDLDGRKSGGKHPGSGKWSTNRMSFHEDLSGERHTRKRYHHGPDDYSDAYLTSHFPDETHLVHDEQVPHWYTQVDPLYGGEGPALKQRSDMGVESHGSSEFLKVHEDHFEYLNPYEFERSKGNAE